MSENNHPQLCFDVGLSCEECTSSSARELARACQGLRGKMVAQLFVQIYPQAACARMLPSFVAAYRLASAEQAAPEFPIVPETPRRGVQTETAPRRAMIAAA
jgi:hypothetical protein